MNKELALKTLESLKRDSLNCNVFSVYDYCDLSMQELLCTFFTKINQVVDATNKTVVLVDWLVNQGLSEEVAKKLDTWLRDGTLANIINETVFNELNRKVNANTQQIELNTRQAKINKLLSEANARQLIKMKKYKFNFGDYKTDENTNTEAFKALFADINTLPTIKNLPWDSVSKGVVVIDLNDMFIEITEPVGLGYEHLSNITIKNGTLKPLPMFTGTRLIHIGNGGHTYQNRIENVIFIGENRINGVYLNDTLNASVKKCYFINTPYGIESETNCHESLIFENYFIWEDYKNSKGDVCVSIGADAHVENNIGVGYNVGIKVNSNANIITNNHFYGMGKWGLESTGTALGNRISGNYFDGCSIKLAHGGFMTSVESNTFINQDNYASVYLTRTNPNAWLQHFKMNNNTIIPYDDTTPTLRPNITIEGNTITVTNGVVLKPNMKGAMIYDYHKDNVGQILEVYPPNKAVIKKFNGMTSSLSGLYIAPTNLMAFSSEYEWSNIVHDTMLINSNSIEPGFEVISGKLNGITQRLGQVKSSYGSDVQRVYIEKTEGFKGAITIPTSKKPNLILVESLIDGKKGISTGVVKLEPNGKISNISYYTSGSGIAKRSEENCIMIYDESGNSFRGSINAINENSLYLEIGSSYTTNNSKVCLEFWLY